MNVFPQPTLMGILNVTPDSFSDGGLYCDINTALRQTAAMVAAGAAVVDIGGESTRPGSCRVPPDEQKRRVLDIVEAVATKLPGVLISVDTTSADVAAATLDAGAGMINDISAGREDGTMFKLVAARKVPICLMHMQGTPETMQDAPRYDDVVAEVRRFLDARVAAARADGVAPEQIVVDPGIGFGKTLAHNVALLAGLRRFTQMPYPVLLGASRKRFIAALDDAREAPPRERVGGSCAAAVIGALAGVRIFRVHDVAAHRQALDIARAVSDVRGGG